MPLFCISSPIVLIGESTRVADVLDSGQDGKAHFKLRGVIVLTEFASSYVPSFTRAFLLPEKTQISDKSSGFRDNFWAVLPSLGWSYFRYTAPTKVGGRNPESFTMFVRLHCRLSRTGSKY